MEIYSNIREVIDGLQGLPWDASLFVNYERWLETPETTPIYLLSELEALEGAQTHESQEPLLARQLGVEGFFDVVTFLRLIANCGGVSPESRALCCIEMINEALAEEALSILADASGLKAALAPAAVS